MRACAGGATVMMVALALFLGGLAGAPRAVADASPKAEASAACRLGGVRIYQRSGVSCRKARRVLGNYIYNGRPGGDWFCGVPDVDSGRNYGRRNVCENEATYARFKYRR